MKGERVFTLWGEDKLAPIWRAFWVLLHLILSYELASMHMVKFPTLTKISWRYRNFWRGRLTVTAALLVIGYHLLFQQEIRDILEEIVKEIENS